jgi:hypothetical protein
MSLKWRLEIHDETKERGSILSHFEFDDFPTLRLKIVENRGRAFLVRPPDHASQQNLPASSIFEVKGLTSSEIRSPKMGRSVSFICEWRSLPRRGL